MKVASQVVSRASVSMDGEVVSAIGRGFLLLLGMADSGTIQIAGKMVDKICKLRIFRDGNGKTNLSLTDVGDGLLVINQFTLYMDCRKGNRPSFIRAGKPDKAERLCEHVTGRCRIYASKVEHGIFGTDMKVELVDGGPFTLTFDSEELGFQ